MATNSFTFTFDTRPLEPLAEKLQTLAGSALARLAAVDVVNEVVPRIERQAAKAMNAGLNLQDAYIASRMESTRAVATGRGTVRAEIVTRGRLTIIGHYPHEQLRQAGTAVRSGVSRGRRPSGARVEIKRGQPVVEPQWFLMRLRRGTDSGERVGLFVRTSANAVKHLYGPAPYSLFRYQINVQGDDFANDVQATAAARMAAVVERVLT